MTKPKIVTLSVAAVVLAAFTLGLAGPASGAPDVRPANLAQAAQLQLRQAAVLRSTHDLIEARFGTLERAVNAANEKAAVRAAEAALSAQAASVDTAAGRVMSELVAMLRVPVTPALRAEHVRNEARAEQLRDFQEAVVRSTHDAIQVRMPALKRVVDGPGEEAAVESVRAALHGQAKLVHVTTQRTTAAILQMIRRSVNQLSR